MRDRGVAKPPSLVAIMWYEGPLVNFGIGAGCFRADTSYRSAHQLPTTSDTNSRESQQTTAGTMTTARRYERLAAAATLSRAVCTNDDQIANNNTVADAPSKLSCDATAKRKPTGPRRRGGWVLVKREASCGIDFDATLSPPSTLSLFSYPILEFLHPR